MHFTGAEESHWGELEIAREAVTGCDLAISMLPAGEHVRGLWLSEGGGQDLLGALPAGAQVIDCSTIDVASARAREWFDQGKVDMITDFPTASTALAVMEIARQKNRVTMPSAGLSTAILGEKCSPLNAQWTTNTYALAAGTAPGLVSFRRTQVILNSLISTSTRRSAKVSTS